MKPTIKVLAELKITPNEHYGLSFEKNLPLRQLSFQKIANAKLSSADGSRTSCLDFLFYKKSIFKTVIMSLLVFISPLWCSGGIDVATFITPLFSKNATIEKRQFRLKPQDVQILQKEAKTEIDSDTVRFYKVKNNDTTEGYGVLIIKKVRTKSAAVLYIMDNTYRLKSIEIVAFFEPKEYKPNVSWQKSFEGKTKEDNLFEGKTIPAISGATLSARAVTDAARLAIAIAERYGK